MTRVRGAFVIVFALAFGLATAGVFAQPHIRRAYLGFGLEEDR